MLTADSRARDFPSLSGISYLNTAAESIPPLCVGEAVAEYVRHKSLGMKGREPHFARVEQCREIAAEMTGLTTEEVAFCSCSSEAYNLLASALQLGEQDEVVVTNLDFPAGATPWLVAPRQPIIKMWRAREGALDLTELAPLLNEHTRLVQISLISFYNGHRIPFAPLHDLVRRHAPNALISVDVTQALGRVVLDCSAADILISSTHKWTLGIHGGCVVGVPARNAARLTTRAGGWFHIANAFASDRFQHAEIKNGAPSFSVGMPNFVALYALDAALRYLKAVGIPAISAHADPLVARIHEGLLALGIRPMSPPAPADCPTGILAFQHPNSVAIYEALQKENIHVMHHAGRIRIAVHGYNTAEDADRLLECLAKV
ncbi:MAG: aminotransferase class V-fold PLP-dependent enzyme [Verrucomicrobiaceae bacterium]|nr:aminotransferase class V-fold PLP-dependent enzyme [Verrucomicrobiaceae bacterium]